MLILGIDPGPKFTAYAILEDGLPVSKGKLANELLFDEIGFYLLGRKKKGLPLFCFLEKMQSFGMPVGAEVFETAYWIGEIKFRLINGLDSPVKLVTRQEIKLHHCNSVRAKDSNIRQVMLDRFGGKDETKKGGILHGFKADIWSALAIACYGYDQLNARKNEKVSSSIYELARDSFSG